MRKRKKEYFIVDGYNVINSWPDLIVLRDNLEFAREKLIDILLEYGRYEGYDVTVVFDALFTCSRQSYENLQDDFHVVFTDEGETADSYIEKIAYLLVREGKEVYVVTSDNDEQTVILGAGAYRIPSLELWRNIKKAKKKMHDKYIHTPVLVARREIGSRITQDIAKKMDKLRKRR